MVCKFANKKEENHKTNSYCFAFISPPFFTLKKVIIYLQKTVLQGKKTPQKLYMCQKNNFKTKYCTGKVFINYFKIKYNFDI